MSGKKALSRRQFIQSAGAATATSLLRLGTPALAAVTQAACSARDAHSAFAVLGTHEAKGFAAIAARIIPTTDTPGAGEAGVVHFFDQAFAGHMAQALEFARNGLAALDATLNTAFADRDATAQDEALTAIEDGEFFGLMRVMTIFGFFGMSSHGGNRDHVSWKIIGFEGHNGAWQYPFGYYDAEIHGGGTGGD